MNAKQDRLISEAAAALRAGKLDVAFQHAGAAADIDPKCVPAKLITSLVHIRQGNGSIAEGILREILASEPDTYEALVSLSTICRDSGKIEESINLGRKALALMPAEPQGINNLGRSLLTARCLPEAAELFKRAIKLQPNFAAAHLNLGKALQLQGKDADAAKSFERAAVLSPTLENLLAHGQMQLTLGNFAEAVEVGSKCASLYSQSTTAHLLLCGALTKSNRGAEAEIHLQRAIELDNDDKELLQIAYRQRPLGHIEAANANFRKAIQQNPNRIAAYEALMQNQKVTEADRHLVEQMRILVDRNDHSPTEQVALHYGLGKALEDLEEFQDAMHHYDEANRVSREIKVGDRPFDRARYAFTIDRMIELFPTQKKALTNTDLSSLPIVIVGMMRSGTSLTEQVISSHPRVAGAGEQMFWPNNWVRSLSTDGLEINFNVLRALGTEYVSELRRHGRDAERVTDKMPGNYIFSGPIHMALPNARIVHVRRLPIDTCLSIWVTPNQAPHEGGYDKGNIAFVYKEYMRLMAFWREVLPPSRFFEIDYETLVAQPEPVIRELLSYCRLEWNEACLRPQENKRLVITPSTWQVRQPFYRTSVERWRRFEPWLGEFSELKDLKH